MRCAIYARVSVADAERPGLTSIQVQVEACEQYIAARCGMGWIQSGPAYIDDGVSASTLRLPGLRALLTPHRRPRATRGR
jgi:hypothetical protein